MCARPVRLHTSSEFSYCFLSEARSILSFPLIFFFLLHSYVACILVNCEKNKSDMPTVCPQPEIQRTSFFFFLKYNNLFLLFCLSCVPQQQEQSRDENLSLCTFKRSRDATYITPMITPMMIAIGKRERNACEE